MKVQFVSGPRAGQTTHVVRDRFSDLLLQAGVLELVEEDQPRTQQRAPVANAASASIPNHATPRWSIFTAPISGYVYIKCAYQRGESFYDGPPENAAAFTVGTHTCPPEVALEYARRKQAGEETGRASASESEIAKAEEARQRNGEAANTYLVQMEGIVK